MITSVAEVLIQELREKCGSTDGIKRTNLFQWKLPSHAFSAISGHVTNLVLNLQELMEAISWLILTDVCDRLRYSLPDISQTVKVLALGAFLHIQEQFEVTSTHM